MNKSTTLSEKTLPEDIQFVLWLFRLTPHAILKLTFENSIIIVIKIMIILPDDKLGDNLALILGNKHGHDVVLKAMYHESKRVREVARQYMEGYDEHCKVVEDMCL